MSASFSKPSIQTLLVVSSNFVFLVFGSLIIAFSLWVVVKEKRLYVYETQYLKTHAYLGQIADRVARVKGYGKRRIVPLTPLQADTQLGIHRNPGPGEIFFAQTTTTPSKVAGEKSAPSLRAIVGDSSGRAFEFALQGSLPVCRGNAVCYVTNGFGKLLLTSHPKIVKGDNLTERSLVKMFLESGLNENYTTEFDPQSLTFKALSYRAVDGTNLVVFLETEGHSVAAEVLRAVFALVLVFIGLIGVQLGIMTLIGRKTVQVFPDILKTLQHFSQEAYLVKLPESISREGDTIRTAVTHLGKTLALKSAQLNLLEGRLTRFFNFQSQISGTEEPLKLIGTTIGFLLFEFDIPSEWSAKVWLPKDKVGSNRGGSGQPPEYEAHALTKRKDGIEFLRLPDGQPVSWSQPPVIDSKGHASAAAQGKSVHVEWSASRRGLLFLLLEQSKVETAVEVDAQSVLPADRLSRFFVQLMGDILQRNLNAAQASDLKKVQQVLDVELEAAGSIQSQLEAQKISPVGYCLSHDSRFASRLSGDWFQLAQDETGELLFLAVADVTGHGVVSAQLSMASLGLFLGWKELQIPIHAQRMHEAHEKEERMVCRETALSELARALDKLTKSASNNILQTALFLIVDLRFHEFSALNLGHVFPIGIGRKGLTSSRNAPLGLHAGEQLSFDSGEIELGEGFLIYTDGLTENFTMGPERGRMTRKIKKIVDGSLDPAKMAQEVLKNISSKWPRKDLPDDVSVIALVRALESQSAVRPAVRTA